MELCRVETLDHRLTHPLPTLAGEERSCEDRYDIASFSGSKHVLGAVRLYWVIENELHWRLDIAFDKDRCQVCKDHGPDNFVLLRNIALNLLKQEKTCKRGIKGKRLIAAWNQNYLCSKYGAVFPSSKLRCVCPGG